ncbi:MAG: uroporphyrinogen-III C-methyltransferase [Planctomycetes bacterium]|nr:uroporphyrinogen-III C-methyltransferase [Planctomycetota bacterium]
MPRAARSPRSAGHVALVGAGPGDPGMLTVRGRDLLQAADVVLYDRLVDRRLLDIPVHAGCRKIYVGKDLPGHASRDAQQDRINALMVRHAKQGRHVVRLKGGDPYVFGRGGEEGLYLHEHGIAFEVVPGVTAALGAAATTGIPFTHRGVAAEVTFATAHEADGASPPPWEALGKLKGTIVFYMGTYTLAHAAEQLVAAGRRGTTPVAVVERATTPRQRTIIGTLTDIAGKVAAAGVKPPSLVVVGDVVNLRPGLNWFESRRLFGRRILNLRPGERAEDALGHRLSLEGAEVVRLPGLAFLPPKSWAPVDRALKRLHTFDWIVLTSGRAARFLLDRAFALGLDGRSFAGTNVIAIGKETRWMLEASPDPMLRADFVPEVATSEGVVAGLGARRIRGKSFLLPRADKAREALPRLLKAAGGRITDVVLYRSVVPKPDRAVVAELAAGRFDAVLVTSGEIAKNLKAWLGRRPWPERTKLVTIGPVTSAAVRGLGWPVSCEAAEPGKLVEATMEALAT